MKKLLFAFLLIAQTALAQTALAQAPAYDFIQVTGEAETKVKPDFVILNATVYSRAPSAQAAQKLNAKEMSRVEKVLKTDFKIETKDIQTASFQVAPQYEYQKDRPVYKGMAVTHMLSVKYRKMDDVGTLLDKLLEGAGQEGNGVRVEEITFGTDQLRNYQAQALEQAMSDAKARAQILAKAGSRNLGVIRKISDSQIRQVGFEPMRGMKTASFSSMAEDAPTRIAPGELTVRALVQVEFEAK